MRTSERKEARFLYIGSEPVGDLDTWHWFFNTIDKSFCYYPAPTNGANSIKSLAGVAMILNIKDPDNKEQKCIECRCNLEEKQWVTDYVFFEDIISEDYILSSDEIPRIFKNERCFRCYKIKNARSVRIVDFEEKKSA